MMEIQKRRHLWEVTIVPPEPWDHYQLTDNIWLEPISAVITCMKEGGKWSWVSVEVKGVRYYLRKNGDHDSRGNGMRVFYNDNLGGGKIPETFHDAVRWAVRHAEDNWLKP